MLLWLLALYSWSCCWCGHCVLGVPVAREADGLGREPGGGGGVGGVGGGHRPRNTGVAEAGSALGVPMSPCPAVFRYERRGGGWVGIVTVPAPPTGMPLVLRIDLAVRAALTTVSRPDLQPAHLSYHHCPIK